jgi:hypothetical protein
VKNSHFQDFVEAGRNPGNLEVRFAPENEPALAGRCGGTVGVLRLAP